MAEGSSRMKMTVFYGTAEERERWLRENARDPRYVVLASNAIHRLQGWGGEVETIVASGAYNLSMVHVLQLERLIRLINNHNGKDAT